jgi:hypothetical protein
MRISRKLTTFTLVLTGALAACVDQPPLAVLSPESLHPREKEILAQLEGISYTGPVMITQQTPIDSRGARPTSWTLSLPEAGVTTLRAALGTNNPGAVALRTILSPAQTDDPEQIDPANNTPTNQLTSASVIRPSILNCPNIGRSRMNMRTALFAYDYQAGTWYRLTQAEILETRLVPRANAAGHYHGGVTETPVRVGTVDPAAGMMTDGVWPATWLVPEFAQEITFQNLVKYTPRETPDETRTDWFYGTSPNVSRFTGLARIPANPQHYDRVGGTATHPENLNDWAHPELVDKMQEAARLYFLATGDRSRVNDMSLQYGGRFDIGGGWGGSHSEHRFADVDTRPYNWSERGRLQFQVALLAAGFARQKILVEGDHFHVRADASPYPCR